MNSDETHNASPSVPAHEQAYRQLSEKILFGDFQPGNSITIQGAADMLGMGITPIREALRRLIAEGALVLHDNRRITIPEMTKDRLKDLIDIRIFLESESVARAVKQMTSQHTEELKLIDRNLDSAIEEGDIPNYLRGNHAFHFYLYKHSKADVSLPIIHGLWLQLGPYMRSICGRFGTSQMEDQHKSIIAALVAGNETEIRKAMRDDIQQGAKILMDTTQQ